MKKNENYEKTLLEGSIEDLIMNVAEVVLNHHYSNVEYDKREDLLQEMYMYMYQQVISGNFNTAYNLRNYLYTTARNAAHNYLYHENKKQSYIDIDECITVGTYDEPEISIEYVDIDDMCKRYDVLGDCRYSLIKYFNKLGVPVLDVPVVLNRNEVGEELLEMVKGSLLWKITQN